MHGAFLRTHGTAQQLRLCVGRMLNPAPRHMHMRMRMHCAPCACTHTCALHLHMHMHRYVGATALGSSAIRWMRSPLASTIAEAPRWTLLDVHRLDDDVCLDYELTPPPAGDDA